MKITIKNSDVTYFEKISGIGRKSTLQIILDLKGKLNDSLLNKITYNWNKLTAKKSLISLGFINKEIDENSKWKMKLKLKVNMSKNLWLNKKKI